MQLTSFVAQEISKLIASFATEVESLESSVLSQSARYCRTVVRVVPISIGNGTFRSPAAQKPLNRST